MGRSEHDGKAQSLSSEQGVRKFFVCCVTWSKGCWEAAGSRAQNSLKAQSLRMWILTRISKIFGAYRNIKDINFFVLHYNCKFGKASQLRAFHCSWPSGFQTLLHSLSSKLTLNPCGFCLEVLSVQFSANLKICLSSNKQTQLRYDLATWRWWSSGPVTAFGKTWNFGWGKMLSIPVCSWFHQS